MGMEDRQTLKIDNASEKGSPAKTRFQRKAGYSAGRGIEAPR